jgi:outer membrane protein assembly factor BamB
MKMKAILRRILVLVILISFFTNSVQAWYNSTTPWNQGQQDSQHTGMGTSTTPSSNSSLWTYEAIGDFRARNIFVDDGRIFAIRGGDFFVLDETTGAFILSGTPGGGGYGGNVGGAYANGKVYYTSQDYIYGRGTVYCYNATTGDQLWMYDTTPGPILDTPTVSGNRVYVGTLNNYIYCIEDGAQKWNKTLGGPIYSSPAVDGDLLCVGCDDGEVYAFNIAGSQPVSLWNFTLGHAIRGPITIGGDKVYVGSGGDGHLYVLNRTDGNLIWSWFSNRGDATLDVAVAYGIVYVGVRAYGSGVYALYANVTAGNYTADSPEPLVWGDNTPYSGDLTITVAGNTMIYCDTYNPTLYARDALTGAVLWKFKAEYAVTPPIVADDHVFIADDYRITCIGSPYPPLTNIYDVNVGGQAFTVAATTNSTMANLNVSTITTAKNMSFTVDSNCQGTGICNITLPNIMLGGPYTVTIGGQAPWSYSTTTLNATHAALYFTYDGTGKYTIQITGTTAYSTLAAPVISVDKSAVDKGQTAHFSISTDTSGGTTPYSYMWLQKAPTGSFVNTGITSQTFDFAPDISAPLGIWSFEVQVTDSASQPVTVTSNAVSVTVNTEPAVIVLPSSWIMDVGQSKTFTANPSGGSGTYSFYQWYVNGTSQNGQTASTFTYTPSSADSYSITVTVNDSLGATSPQSSAAAVEVNSNPTVSVQPPTWNMDLGQSQTFTANTGGGAPPYSYVWSIDYVAQPGNNSSTFVYIPSTLGAHNILVAVTDSVGGQVGSYSDINVFSALVAPTASGSNSTITQGETLTLNVTALSSGLAPYNYQWLQKAPGESSYSNITGATSSTYAVITSTSTATGTWSFEVQVTDSATQPVTVTSNPVEVTLQAVIPEISSGMMLVLFVFSFSTLALVLGSFKLRKQCK